ncbi:hypothetical protein Tco_1384368 [Tanacetum coccineum]
MAQVERYKDPKVFETSDGLAAIQAQLNNLGREIEKAQDVKILDAYDHTLPQKEKDPRSFTLPCFIYKICFNKALVDLGASVSVMPFSTYTNHGLGNLSHTRLTVELADQTIKQPRGIAENVLVKDRKSHVRDMIDMPIFIVGSFGARLIIFIVPRPLTDDDMTKDIGASRHEIILQEVARVHSSQTRIGAYRTALDTTYRAVWTLSF